MQRAQQLKLFKSKIVLDKLFILKHSFHNLTLIAKLIRLSQTDMSFELEAKKTHWDMIWLET
jgi:dihydropteroate synthase